MLHQEDESVSLIHQFLDMWGCQYKPSIIYKKSPSKLIVSYNERRKYHCKIDTQKIENLQEVALPVVELKVSRVTHFLNWKSVLNIIQSNRTSNNQQSKKIKFKENQL